MLDKFFKIVAERCDKDAVSFGDDNFNYYNEGVVIVAACVDGHAKEYDVFRNADTAVATGDGKTRTAQEYFTSNKASEVDVFYKNVAKNCYDDLRLQDYGNEGLAIFEVCLAEHERRYHDLTSDDEIAADDCPAAEDGG